MFDYHYKCNVKPETAENWWSFICWFFQIFSAQECVEIMMMRQKNINKFLFNLKLHEKSLKIPWTLCCINIDCVQKIQKRKNKTEKTTIEFFVGFVVCLYKVLHQISFLIHLYWNVVVLFCLFHWLLTIYWLIIVCQLFTVGFQKILIFFVKNLPTFFSFMRLNVLHNNAVCCLLENKRVSQHQHVTLLKTEFIYSCRLKIVSELVASCRLLSLGLCSFRWYAV